MPYDREFTSPVSETAHDPLESTSSNRSEAYDEFFSNESINYLNYRHRDFVPAYQRRFNYAGPRSTFIRTTEFGIPEGSQYRSASVPERQPPQTRQPRQASQPRTRTSEPSTSKQAGKPSTSGGNQFQQFRETNSGIPASTGAISKTKGSTNCKPASSASKSTESCIKGKKNKKQSTSVPQDRDSVPPRVLTFQGDIEAPRSRSNSSDSDHSCDSDDKPYVYHLIAYEDRSKRCGYTHYRVIYNAKTGQPEMIDDLDEQEKKIVVEFCHLLEKSKQLFNGLRDLPQYGHRQWQGYFGKTFDTYTRIWKFQQQHRAILDRKFGLKRWQVGEIASKIGQLYYHYYLRTSETNYLNEAFSFYAAIRGRSYYSKAAKEDRSDLMVKKLRYYARFIVVCLLLKKLKLVRDLIIELERQVIDYSKTYDPDDHLEWNVVLDEIKSFMKAEAIVAVIHIDSSTIVLCHRLTPFTTPPVERSAMMNLTLQEILIVGSCSDQVKFSELTMDMYRMLQTLEREPQQDVNHIYDASPVGHPGRNFAGMPSTKGGYGDANNERVPKLDNPHKYLLYKPSLSQLLVFLSSGFKELPANGAMMLYISGDGCFSNNKHPENMAYDLGGVKTNSRHESDFSRRGVHLRDPHCLHPGDLYPFTRKPLFLIIDSDNSHVFQHVPRYFGQPVVTLMSPQELPPQLQEQQSSGSLFTMFLNSPLTALCHSCNLSSVPYHDWERCQSYIERFNTEASVLFTRSRIDMAYIHFFGDDFLRLILVRYVFCEVALRLHRDFRIRQMLPRCSPSLPEEELLSHPILRGLVLDLVAHLDLMSYFHETSR